jgi:hypothetical protein
MKIFKSKNLPSCHEQYSTACTKLYIVFGCTNMRKEKDTDKLYLLILARTIYTVGGYFFMFHLNILTGELGTGDVV